MQVHAIKIDIFNLLDIALWASGGENVEIVILHSTNLRYSRYSIIAILDLRTEGKQKSP